MLYVEGSFSFHHRKELQLHDKMILFSFYECVALKLLLVSSYAYGVGIKLLSQPNLVIWSFVNELLPAPFQTVLLWRIPIKLPKFHY